MRSAISLFTVSVLLLCVGRAHAADLFNESFDYDTGTDLIGQGGWFAHESSTATSGALIGERDGNTFLDSVSDVGGFITAMRPVNLFAGTGVDRVEMTWTTNMGSGDYPDAGDPRSHNFSVGLSSGDNISRIGFFPSNTSIFFDGRNVAADRILISGDNATSAAMFGQESGWMLFADRVTGEIGGGIDPGLTGNFTMYDSSFIDPAVAASFDTVRVFLDGRGSDFASAEIDDIVITPEPASLALIGVGALALLIRNRRR